MYEWFLKQAFLGISYFGPDDGGAGSDGGGDGGGDAGSGTVLDGGNTPSGTWRDAIAKEYREDPNIRQVNDINTLAKNYIETKRMVGADKVTKPRDSWTPDDWNKFYGEIGRPEKPEEYELPSAEEAKDVTLDEEALKETVAMYHEAGLTKRQVKQLLTKQIEKARGIQETVRTQAESQRTEAERALRMKWGDSYESNVGLARDLVNRFGSDSLKQRLSGEDGNNTDLIELFHDIGAVLLEDQAMGGHAGGFSAGDSASAKAQIATLMRDQEFQRVLLNNDLPGHREAVSQWEELHRKAYGTEPVTG